VRWRRSAGTVAAWETDAPAAFLEVPTGPDCCMSPSNDGYPLIVPREGKRVRLLTRKRHDWTIIESALRLRERHS
jgi:bifunctional non-homologous end joining protein LigD